MASILSPFSRVPAARIAGMQKKPLPILLHSRPKGSLCHAPAQASFCIFRAGMTSCIFAVCICTCEENEGLQREHLFAAGFPIGARSIPVGTRFCSAKSSVLYLLRPLTLEGGCHRTGQTFSCGSRRTNICKHGRLADIRSSGVGDAAKCRSLTETMLYHRGSKRYIKPAAATHPQKSSLIHPSFRRLFSKLHSMLQ